MLLRSTSRFVSSKSVTGCQFYSQACDLYRRSHRRQSRSANACRRILWHLKPTDGYQTLITLAASMRDDRRVLDTRRWPSLGCRQLLDACRFLMRGRRN